MPDCQEAPDSIPSKRSALFTFLSKHLRHLSIFFEKELSLPFQLNFRLPLLAVVTLRSTFLTDASLF